MTQVMVRDKFKPDRVEENEELVRAVYGEIRRSEPAGPHRVLQGRQPARLLGARVV
jgi:hypothetical protein